MNRAFEEVRHTVAMAMLDAEDHLSTFQNEMHAIGADFSNSELQFICFPTMVATLYGLPMDKDDAVNYACECANHLDGSTESKQDFIEKMKEWR